jgi:hypothetical protein
MEEEKAAQQSVPKPKENHQVPLVSRPDEKVTAEPSPELPTSVAMATVSGNVKKELDGPLGGAHVSVEISMDSDADGKYKLTIPVSERKKLTMKISCLGFVSQSREIEVSPNGQLTVDFSMGKGKSSLEGTVCDEETGQLLAEAYVSIESQKMYTSADGHFAFKEIDANRRYPLTAYKDGYETTSFLAEWVEPGKPLMCQIKLAKKKPQEEKKKNPPKQETRPPALGHRGRDREYEREGRIRDSE